MNCLAVATATQFAPGEQLENGRQESEGPSSDQALALLQGIATVCSANLQDPRRAGQTIGASKKDGDDNRPGWRRSGLGPGLLRRIWDTCWAILRQRCPRCHKGSIFRGPFAMNDPCPGCGLLFQREEGYFLGAMYMSYPITSAILIPIYFLVEELLPTWHSLLLVPVATLLYLPFVPAVFRYSRVLWIYFDRLGDPCDPGLLTAYEKTRLDELPNPKTTLDSRVSNRTNDSA